MNILRCNTLIIYLLMVMIFTIILPDIASAYGVNNPNLNSPEPSGNIISYEVRYMNVLANEASEFIFSLPELSIYKISTYGKGDEFNFPVRIEYLRGLSKLVNKSPPGNIYRNENLLINSTKINYVSVEYKVKDTWLKSNNIDLIRTKPYLLRWNGSEWLMLKSKQLIDDGRYTYFSVTNAGSYGNNIFSISAFQIGVDSNITVIGNVDNIEPFVTGIEEATDLPEDNKLTKKPNMIILVLSIGILIVALGILKFGRKDK